MDTATLQKQRCSIHLSLRLAKHQHLWVDESKLENHVECDMLIERISYFEEVTYLGLHLLALNFRLKGDVQCLLKVFFFELC